MATLYNLARMTTVTTGTGTITLGSAVNGFLTFVLAGVVDGITIPYAINDNDGSTSASEIGTGVYDEASQTLTRSVTKSTNSDTAIDLSGTAEVLITPRAEDLAFINDIATARILGRDDAGLGPVEELTAAEVRTLINVEDAADVTDTANVDAAGAVMNTDTTTAAMSFVIDEDNMASDLDTKAPTQQSVKAYADTKIGGSTGGTDNRLLRSNGAGGTTLQNTGITVDDSDNVSGIGTLSTSGNLTLGSVTNTALQFGGVGYGEIKNTATDQQIHIAGGNTLSQGGNVVLYGQSHATKDGSIEFRRGATNKLAYDHSNSQWVASVAFAFDDEILQAEQATPGTPSSGYGTQWWNTSGHLYAKNDAGDAYKLTASQSFVLACSDETSDLTTGTAKITFRMPYAFTIEEVRASCNTAPVGATITVDINESGATILSTKLTIDASEKTSTTAAAAAVVSDASLADDAEITVDIDQVGSSTAGKGLKVTIIGRPT